MARLVRAGNNQFAWHEAAVEMSTYPTSNLRSTRVLTFVEIGAWLGGALAIGVYAEDLSRQHSAREEGLQYFAQLRAQEQIARSEAKDLSTGPIDMSHWSKARVKEFHEAALRPVAPIGVLRIPSVKLSVPIYEGTSDETLQRGAGRIEGTAPLGEEGNIGIAAHRDSFFRALKDLAVGDILVLERVDGVDRYRIAGTTIVNPSDVSVLKPTDSSTITLVTCYPFYFVGSAPQRFIVKAERVAGPDSRDALVRTAARSAPHAE